MKAVRASIGALAALGVAACTPAASGSSAAIPMLVDDTPVSMSRTWLDSMPNVSQVRKAPRVDPSVLDSIVICSDYGARRTRGRLERCLPCLPTLASPEDAQRVEHVRQVLAFAPTPMHGYSAGLATCLTHGYGAGAPGLPANRDLRVMLASFQLFSGDAAERAYALALVDTLVDSLVRRADSAAAVRAVGALGDAVAERARRLLARPASLPVTAAERSVHDVGRSAARFARLPPVPSPSRALGESESEWARALFTHAAQLATSDDVRARYIRRALATLVERERWSALDAAAQAVLVAVPHDSVAPIARALARYHLVADPVREYPAVMATFDTALRAMPRVDSAAYDDFDYVLRSSDDRWRRDFLIGDRLVLDARSWAVSDPLWLTPVNELRLVRRARLAEANFRYAYLAKDGESGGETVPGVVLLKRGAPSPRWTVTTNGAVASYARRWPSGDLLSQPILGDSLHWLSMYSDFMTLPHRLVAPRVTRQLCGSLFACVAADYASWHDVPFLEHRGRIDVTLARFRGVADSTDLYVGARMPLRLFRTNTHPQSHPGDVLLFGATVATPSGTILFQSIERRPLPGARELVWTAEWRARVRLDDLMHRVEIYEPKTLRAALGSRLLTAAADARFAVTGFGMSDVLVADRVREARQPVRRWSDLASVPNGAALAPRQSIDLAWEIYDLEAAPDGSARWRVSLSREDGTPVSRTDVRALLLGAPDAGTTVESDEIDPSAITYQRSARREPVVVETMRFMMPETDVGRYVIRVRVKDLVSGRETSRAVSLNVMNPNRDTR